MQKNLDHFMIFLTMSDFGGRWFVTLKNRGRSSKFKAQKRIYVGAAVWDRVPTFKEAVPYPPPPPPSTRGRVVSVRIRLWEGVGGERRGRVSRGSGLVSGGHRKRMKPSQNGGKRPYWWRSHFSIFHLIPQGSVTPPPIGWIRFQHGGAHVTARRDLARCGPRC